jgi:hypothetical protein
MKKNSFCADKPFQINDILHFENYAKGVHKLSFLSKSYIMKENGKHKQRSFCLAVPTKEINFLQVHWGSKGVSKIINMAHASKYFSRYE